MLTDIEIDKIVEFDRNDEMSDGRAAKAITQLRAELAEQKADAMKWFGVALEQKHELEQERELADELAQASKRGLNYLENTENELGILLDSAESLRDALTTHATRRNK